MPMYEYRCRNCGHSFDELVLSSIADEDIECPKCGEYQSEKLMSAFASSGRASADVSSVGGGSSCGTGGFT